MSKKTVRARDRALGEHAAEEYQKGEERRRERRAALARYTVQAQLYAMYEAAALGRPA